MKIFHHKKFTGAVLGFALILSGASCKKSFYTGANINPNAPEPSSIIPSVMLSTVEGAIAYSIGGDFSRFSSLNLQQTKGVSRQAQGYYTYVYTSQDFDNAWANTYTAVLENNKVLQDISDARKFHAYSGVARILKAFMLQTAVDTWGSIPYSDALQGNDQLQPKYDTDEGLYDTVTNLLTAAIAELNNADAGALVPGGEDFIYGGDTDKWIKFAHAIQGRIYLHQSKGNAAMAAKALAEFSQSFTENADNATFRFQATDNGANPWYQFNTQRGDISFSQGGTATKMIALHDPRLPILIDTLKADGEDGLLYYGNQDGPVELISFDEVMFASAELTLRNGGTVGDAQAFYKTAIDSNMTKLGVSRPDIDTYLATNGTLPGSTDAAIAQIVTQAYLGLYLNPEAWTTWRRTGSPALTPVAGSGVPRRLLYPQTEYSYNKTNIPNSSSVTLLAPKIFWDK